MSSFTAFAWFLAIMSGLAAAVTAAHVKLGDLIIPDKAGLVSDLVSPGNFVLVKQGMRKRRSSPRSASSGRRPTEPPPRNTPPR
jgi:hypothetical protein